MDILTFIIFIIYCGLLTYKFVMAIDRGFGGMAVIFMLEIFMFMYLADALLKMQM